MVTCMSVEGKRAKTEERTTIHRLLIQPTQPCRSKQFRTPMSTTSFTCTLTGPSEQFGKPNQRITTSFEYLYDEWSVQKTVSTNHNKLCIPPRWLVRPLPLLTCILYSWSRNDSESGERTILRSACISWRHFLSKRRNSHRPVKTGKKLGCEIIVLWFTWRVQKPAGKCYVTGGSFPIQCRCVSEIFLDTA